MASTIKGITVSIGGDTTNLKKSLEGVDKTSKDLQRELNLVNKELKFNPDSATLLAQKQEILAEKVNATREKLEKLNEVQEQVERQAKSGDLGAEEYRAYQREVESTTSQLSYLENELGETGDKFNEVQRRSGQITFKNAEDKVDHVKGKFKDFSEDAVKRLDSVSEKAKKIGDGLDKAGGVLNKASAGGAAILAGSVASFKDLDNGYDIIVKKTGVTGDAFDKLKATADDLFSNNSFDMQAIGSAIGEIYTRFGYTDEKLKAVSETYLQFAKINDTDVSNSVAKSSQIVQAWNLSAEQIPDLLGLITGKAQETGISAEGLMDKVLQNNASFKEMGLSLEESVSLMAQFEKNGVNDSTALAALKAAVKNATKEGKSLSEALKDNVADIKNAKTDTEALQVATKLFGAKGAAEMAHAIREGRINFDNLSTSMGDYKDTVKKTYEGTLDPLEKSKKGLNNLKLAGAELANVALKEGEPLIEDVIEGIKGVTEWIKKLNPEQKQMLIKAIEIVAVAGPAVKITGGIAKGIGSIASVASSVIPKLVGATAAQEGLNVAMDSNPVGAVVLAITALIAALGGMNAALDAAQERRFDELGFTEQADKLQESVDKVKKLKDEVNGLRDDIDKSFDSFSTEMGTVDEYKNRLDELLGKATLTPEEQAELVTIGDYFSEKYPDFKTAWDKYKKVDNDGTVKIDEDVKKIKDNLDSLIEKYKKVAASQALSNLSTKVTESFIESKQKTNEAAIEYIKAQNELDKFLSDYDIDDNLLELMKWAAESKNPTQAEAAANEAQRQLRLHGHDDVNAEDLYKQYTKLKEGVDSINESYKETVSTTAELKQKSDEYAQMQAVLNGNYDNASAVLMAYYNNLITTEDIEKSKWGSLDNLKNKARETADETNKSETYIKQITDESTEYAQNKLGLTKKSSKDAVNSCNSEFEKLPSIVGRTMDNLKKMIEEKQPELNGAMGDSASLGIKEFFKRVNGEKSKAEDAGKNFILGFTNGLSDKTGLSKIWTATKNIASNTINSIKKFLGIQSPSKEAEKLGRFFGMGFVNGIEQNQAAARKAAQNLSGAAKSSLSLGAFDFGRIKNTYASIGKLRSSGIAETQSRINNISNSTSKNINGGVNVTINQAKLDTDADVERMGEKLADIIIRKGMEWG